MNLKGFSALHCAAGQGKIGIVRMLLNAGANPDLQTRDGFTPLMLTASSTRAWPEVADALLKCGAQANLRGLNSYIMCTACVTQVIKCF